MYDGMRTIAAVIVAAATLDGAVRSPVQERAADGAAVGARQAAHAILSRHCVECHGGRATRGGLDLSTRAGLVKGGDSGEVFSTGGAQASRLYQLVSHAATPGMPLGRPKLSDEEIATLAAWIDEGAPYDQPLRSTNAATEEEWWSLRPLAHAVPPAVRQAELANWPRTPIDLFLLDRLAAKELSPSPEADRRTLLRRVMFDLVGLPPTPAQTAQFLADESPDAYERLVDRLLASPQFGERWARHWMDTVHYAETHGHDQDRPRPNAWPYRDYLIQAFNDDTPYARFVTEQLAGDVLFPDDPRALVAMGFLATGPWDESSLRDIREDTIDREIARYLDRDDLVTTAMSTLVSSTVHCARCHAHKFDPISQAEYYRLQAVFSGIDKADRAYDTDPHVAGRRKTLAASRAELPQRAASADSTLLAGDLQARVAAWEQSLAQASSLWRILDAETLASSEGASLSKLSDGSILAGGMKPETDVYTIIAATDARRVTGLRLEVLLDDSLPQKGPGRQDNGNLHLNEISVQAARRGLAGETAWQPVGLVSPRADFNQAGWTIDMAVDGNPATAWGIHPEVSRPHLAVFAFSEPVECADGVRLQVRLEQTHGRSHLIGRLRLSATNAPLPLPLTTETLPRELAAILAVPMEQRDDRQRAELAAYVVRHELESELASLPPQQKVYSATNKFQADGSFRPAATPRVVNLLKRGDINTPGPAAVPGALDCVPGLDAKFDGLDTGDEGARRAALAGWMTDARNVLAWRSIVNRVWHYHFGKGIVDTPNDFGRMGATPSHPELLDWLTVEFQKSGGSLKGLHRLIVTSAAYRQSSQSRPRDAEIDGDNRLLWRMNRTRLDAESIRDAVLVISGRLDPAMGGPSVKQFIESPGIHVTPNVDYLTFDPDRPENYRRSVYRFIFRTLPDPFMETLDCADPSQLTPVRGASVTALQALTMLNNKFVVRQSEHIAARLESLAGDEAGRVRQAYQSILGRDATPHEVDLVSTYVRQHGLANAVRMLLNSNEFMFVN